MARLPRALAVGALVAGSLTLAASSSTTATGSDDLISLVTVEADTREERQRLVDLGLDLTEHAGHDYVEVVLHGADDAATLAAAGFTWQVRIPDLVAREAERAALDAAYAASATTPAMPSGRKAYRHLADFEWDMRELAKRNPGLVKLIRLPHDSVEGRPIHGIEITNDPHADDTKPVFVLMGAHHAREWPSAEHAIEYGFDLVNTWKAGDARTRDLLSRGRVIIVPVVNVDGFHLSRTSSATFDGREIQDIEGTRGGDGYTVMQLGPQGAYKRKNCRIVDGEATPEGACELPGNRYAGTDLNRNYGGLWGGAGASALGHEDTYRGPAPFSEPETQNIRELISANQVTMMISNHTFSNLILRPPGVKAHGVTVDEPAMRDLGAAMAEQNGYLNQAGFELYDTTGTTEDWSYGATGGYGYTFEIGPHEFHPPYEETVGLFYGTGKLAGKGNREAYHLAFATATDPAHHSVISGTAPNGAVLRLKKSFETMTSPVRPLETWQTDDPGLAGDPIALDDVLETTSVVRGRFDLHANPSTRPAVLERKVYEIATEPSSTFTHEGGAIEREAHVDVLFSLDAPTARVQIDLDWPTPDDLDLEVFRQVGGTLEPVDSSGNPPGLKEQVVIDDPEPGEYVFRVTNYASRTASWTITAGTYDVEVVETHPALAPFETWTLTCERPDGTVLQTVEVLVSRGDRVVVDLTACRRAW